MLLLEFNQLLCEASSLRSILPDLSRDHPIFVFLHGNSKQISSRPNLEDIFPVGSFYRSIRFPSQVQVYPSSIDEMHLDRTSVAPVAWVIKGQTADVLIVKRRSNEFYSYWIESQALKPFTRTTVGPLFQQNLYGDYRKKEEREQERKETIEQLNQAVGGIKSVWKVGPESDIPAKTKLKRSFQTLQHDRSDRLKSKYWRGDGASVSHNDENLLVRRRPAWRSDLESAARHRLRVIKALGGERASTEFLLKATADLELIKRDLSWMDNLPWYTENDPLAEEEHVPVFLLRCMKRAIDKVWRDLSGDEQDDFDFWGKHTLAGGSTEPVDKLYQQGRMHRGAKIMGKVLAQYQKELMGISHLYEQQLMESEWSDKWMANNRRLVQLVGVRALSDPRAMTMAQVPARPRLYYSPKGHTEREQNLVMQRQRDWERELTAAVVEIIDRSAIRGHVPAYRDWLIKEYLRGDYNLEDLTSQTVHNLYKYQLLIGELGEDFAKEWPVNRLDGERLEQLTNHYSEVIRQLLRRDEEARLEKYADRVEILNTEQFQAWVPLNAEASVLFNRSQPGPMANFCTGTGLESNYWNVYSSTGPLIQLLVKTELDTPYGKWLISSSHKEIRESDQKKGDDVVFAYKYPGLLKIIAQALTKHQQEIEQRAESQGLKYNISQEPENLARSFPNSWWNSKK